MTKDNYFCWAKECNDTDSSQQKRYRVFNVEVSKEEYENIKKIYHKLEFDKNESYTTRYQTAFRKMWNGLTDTEKQEYYDIPHFNWEGFTFITGVEQEKELTARDKFVKEGRTKKAFEDIITNHNKS